MKKIFTLEYRVDESWHLDKFKEVSEVFRQVKTMETQLKQWRHLKKTPDILIDF